MDKGPHHRFALRGPLRGLLAFTVAVLPVAGHAQTSEVTAEEGAADANSIAPDTAAPDSASAPDTAAPDSASKEPTEPDSQLQGDQGSDSEEAPEFESTEDSAPSAEEAEPVAGAPQEDSPSEDAPHPAPEPPGPTSHLEDDEGWLQWPFAKKNMDRPRTGKPHRWMGAGAFVGWVSRPSQSESIEYRPGIAWGGYVRPVLSSWLGLRLFYREERIPVQVQPGAFDYLGDTYDDDFVQPDLEVLNLGARLEPTLVVHPRFRVRGIVGWSWLWFQVPHPKSDDFEMKRSYRSAVEMDINFGAGFSFDIVKNWVDFSLDASYGITAARTGSAYEPAQIVRDGEIKHIAPLPLLHNSFDVLISLGVIL